MPTWSDLQSRNATVRSQSVRTVGDEVLVVDARARMTPGSFVEEKLRAALTARLRRRKPR